MLALVSVEGLSYRGPAERLAVRDRDRDEPPRPRPPPPVRPAGRGAREGARPRNWFPPTVDRHDAQARRRDPDGLRHGALGPEEAAAVRAALAADPEAAADVDRFRESARLVRAAFDDTLAEPVPPTLERRVRAAARVAEAERHALDALVRRRGRRPLALAASVALLLGLGIGSRLSPGAGDEALPGLGAALAATASGERATLPDGATLTPLATFRDRDGRWCRRFARAEDGRTGEGVACRDAEGGWRLAFLVPDGAAASGDYAPAGEEPSLADSLADRMRAGDPLATSGSAT